MVIIQRHMTLCNGHYPTPHVNIQVPHFPGHTHSQTHTPSPAAVPGIPTTLPSHLWPPWLTISIKHTARNWRGIQWELSACEYLVATHPQLQYEIWCEERWSRHEMTGRQAASRLLLWSTLGPLCPPNAPISHHAGNTSNTDSSCN